MQYISRTFWSCTTEIVPHWAALHPITASTSAYLNPAFCFCDLWPQEIPHEWNPTPVICGYSPCPPSNRFNSPPLYVKSIFCNWLIHHHVTPPSGYCERGVQSNSFGSFVLDLFIRLFLCTGVFACMFILYHICAWYWMRTSDLLEQELAGNHHVGAGIWNQVLWEKSKLPPFYKWDLPFTFTNKGLLMNNIPDNQDKGENTVKAWVSPRLSQSNDWKRTVLVTPWNRSGLAHVCPNMEKQKLKIC